MTCAIGVPVATARAEQEKSICPAFVTVTRFLDISAYSPDKLCNYWSKIFEIFSKYAKRCALFFFFEMLFRRYWQGGITFRHTYVISTFYCQFSQPSQIIKSSNHYHHADINHPSNKMLLSMWLNKLHKTPRQAIQFEQFDDLFGFPTLRSASGASPRSFVWGGADW